MQMQQESGWVEIRPLVGEESISLLSYQIINFAIACAACMNGATDILDIATYVGISLLSLCNINAMMRDARIYLYV